jgi:hypothetical protein
VRSRRPSVIAKRYRRPARSAGPQPSSVSGERRGQELARGGDAVGIGERQVEVELVDSRVDQLADRGDDIVRFADREAVRRLGTSGVGDEVADQARLLRVGRQEQ